MVDFVAFDLHTVKKYFHIIRTRIPVGASLLAMQTTRCICLIAVMQSLAGQLPQDWHPLRVSRQWPAQKPVGASLLAIQAARCICLNAVMQSLAGQLPRLAPSENIAAVASSKACGSEPARDSGGAVYLFKRSDAIAGRPAPTIGTL